MHLKVQKILLTLFITGVITATAAGPVATNTYAWFHKQHHKEKRVEHVKKIFVTVVRRKTIIKFVPRPIFVLRSVFVPINIPIPVFNGGNITNTNTNNNNNTNNNSQTQNVTQNANPQINITNDNNPNLNNNTTITINR